MVMNRKSMWLAGGSVGLLLLAGLAWSQVAPEATPKSQVSPPASGPVPVETTVPQSRAGAAALADARKSQMGERMRIVLSRGQDQGALLRQIQASTVPVLAPADPSLLSSARFYPGDDIYTLVLRSPGRIIQIFGSTKVFVAPEGAIPPPSATTLEQARGRLPLTDSLIAAQRTGLENTIVGRTEDGVNVSFVRFGAVYGVRFICDDLNALDCSDAAAVQFATSLELIGGGGL